jgi:hypothetical protein
LSCTYELNLQILNPDLLPDKKNFTYYIISSSGFANTTLALLSNFNKKIEKEDIKKICCEIISQNKGLKEIDIEVELSSVYDILKSIKVKKVIPEDLNLQLKEYSIIAKSFFKVYTATDNTLIEKVITKYLEPLINRISKEDIEIKDYQFCFKLYLSQALNTYSSAQTLVFGNQQKKMKISIIL